MWLVSYAGGQYWAMPNPVKDRIEDWLITHYQNGTLMPNPFKVPKNRLVFISTTVQHPPNGIQAKASSISY